VPRHNVDCIIDIKDHSAANNSAPDIDESIVEADDLAQRRRILPARDGRLRAEVLAMSGRRPQATFRRDPSHVAHRSPIILGAPPRWRGAGYPPLTPRSEENGPHRTRLGFSCAKQMAGGSWVGYLLSWRATKINALQRCFSWPKEEERREALKSSKVLRRNKQVILLRGKVAL
jgi:hypothetical protein